MSELISGKEALIALANGEEVQWTSELESQGVWYNNTSTLMVDEILGCETEETDDISGMKIYFRLKPKTININGIEIEKPKDIVIDPITGSVGLVYDDLRLSEKVAKELWSIFNVI